METRKFTSLEDLPLVLRVEDLMPILAIGRNTAYELVRCGRIRSVRIGNQFRIPRDAVIEFLTHGSVRTLLGDVVTHPPANLEKDIALWGKSTNQGQQILCCCPNTG